MTFDPGNPTPLSVPVFPSDHRMRTKAGVVYVPDVVHLDGCADGLATGTHGKRCLCECHLAPKPRRAA